MDLNHWAWRLGLTTSNLEVQRALEAFKTSSEVKVLLDQSRTYTDFAALTSGPQAAEMKILTDVSMVSRETWKSVEAARFQTLEMMDSQAAIEAAKLAVGLEWQLAALRPGRALDELFAVARQPFELDHLVREATRMSPLFETAMGRDLFQVERVLESLRLGPTPIGAFELPDLHILEGEEPGQSEENGPELIIPKEARDRLILVEFLPVRVMQEIRRCPEMMRKLTPRQFEEMTAELLNGLGFEDIMLTPRSRDRGRDVVAVRRIQGIPLLFAFECKKYAERNRVQLSTLRALLGTVSHGATKANKGVLVTTSRFSRGARQFILSEALIDGKDFDDLVKWLQEYRRR